MADGSIELIFEEMGKFAKNTFPDATAQDHLRKLGKEAKEAEENPTDIEEYADCLLCLFGAVGKQGFTFNQLLEATRDKLFVVANRQWEKQSDGTYQHIKPTTNV